ncbi:MAG: SOS response-associated peptidase [Acidimicrobiia bacterium]
MCGRMVATTSTDDLAELFRAETFVDPDDQPDWNVAPTVAVRAVTEEASRRRIRRYRWGLVRRSAPRMGAGPPMINARSETVATKGIFAPLLARRRCIVPADGFYEWQRLPGGKKQPFFLHPAQGGVFAFAGLWDVWSGPEGQVVPCLTILTTAADPAVARIHDRMPLILPAPNWDAWLAPELRDVEALFSMIISPATGGIALHPVSDAVNSVANNCAALVAPVVIAQGALFG